METCNITHHSLNLIVCNFVNIFTQSKFCLDNFVAFLFVCICNRVECCIKILFEVGSFNLLSVHQCSVHIDIKKSTMTTLSALCVSVESLGSSPLHYNCVESLGFPSTLQPFPVGAGESIFIPPNMTCDLMSMSLGMFCWLAGTIYS